MQMDFLRTLSNMNCSLRNRNQVADFLKREMHAVCPTLENWEEDKRRCRLPAWHKPGRRGSLAVISYVDEPGLIISSFLGRGYLGFEVYGNVFTNALHTENIRIWGREKAMPALVGIRKEYWTALDRLHTEVDTCSLYIDTGIQNIERLKREVRIGDFAEYDCEFLNLGDSFYGGKGLSMKAGSVLLLRLASLLPKEMEVWLLLYGKSSCDKGELRRDLELIQPDIVLHIDCADIKKVKYGCLGGGPVVSMGAMVDHGLTNKALRLAEKLNISVQPDYIHAKGEKEKIAILSIGKGCPVLEFGLPIENYGMAYEIMAASDLENTFQLADGVIKELREE